MSELKKDWITDGLIDFEYKKYVLLAYLKHVEGNFDKTKLYPFLSDLIKHYSGTLSFHKRKTLLKTGFPKEITGLDWDEMRLSYGDTVKDSELMMQLDEIVAYALPRMKETLGLGKERYEEIESQLLIEPIGIMPIYKDEGYVLIETGNQRLTNIYQYKISKFVMSGEGVRGIYLSLIQSLKRGMGDTLEQVKLNLIKAYENLPNPATFLIRSTAQYPMKETTLPITKRLVLQTVESY